MRRVTPLLERLLARVDADGPCWDWTGAIDPNGYGVIGRGRRGDGTVQTHRAAWEQLVGTIPPGLDLDHLCRNRRCCNPEHLEPVTRRENVMRGARRPGYRRHVMRCSRGHEFDYSNGKQRICMTCKRIHARASYARKKASV